jgi:hypothetical protein
VYVCIRQHTPAVVSMRQHEAAQHVHHRFDDICKAAYVSIRQHTSAYVKDLRQHGRRQCAQGPDEGRACQRARASHARTAHTRKARQRPPAYVSIRQHTSAYVSIRARISLAQHTHVLQAGGADLRGQIYTYIDI